MSEHVKDIEDPPRDPEGPIGWPVKCQVCGTLRQPKDSIFCRDCGEPVIVWGWAP
jgi:hypothetical protein